MTEKLNPVPDTCGILRWTTGVVPGGSGFRSDEEVARLDRTPVDKVFEQIERDREFRKSEGLALPAKPVKEK